MAEVLGVVASGIAVGTLAGKVTSSIVKLKDCWNQIKDAPADINTILLEIECFELIVSQIQSGPQIPDSQFDNVCLSKSLSLCDQAVNELASLVDELAEKIRDKGGWRKKVGGVKVVLKKDDLRRCEARMERAMRLLGLAQQSHTFAMMQLQPEIIVARVATHIQSVTTIQTSETTVELGRSDNETPTPSSPNLVTRQYNTWISSASWMKFLLGSFEYQSRGRVHKGKPRHEFDARYKLPCWISQTAFRVHGYNYLSTWQIKSQSYRILPRNSPFFTAVRQDDISTVQKLLMNGSALLTDREELYEESAVHVAARYGKTKMTTLLLQAGAEVSVLDRYQQYVPNLLTRFNTNLYSFDNCKKLNKISIVISDPFSTPFQDLVIYNAIDHTPLDICRLLLDSGARDELIGSEDVVWFTKGSIELFKYLQNQIYPPYDGRSIAERMMWASRIVRGYSHNSPALVELALCPDGIITLEMATWKDNESGDTMLHSLALGVASIHQDGTIIDSDLDHHYVERLRTMPTCSKYPKYVYMAEMWQSLIERFVNVGALIHALNAEEHTPLRLLIESFRQFDDSSWFEWEYVLYPWLTSLHRCGVNLQQYGDRERELGTFKFWDYSPLTFGEDKLMVGITYGPLLSDWRLWFQEPTDQFAGEFWGSLGLGPWYPDEKEFEMAMPGAFTDD